jgi:hypothetical protein
MMSPSDCEYLANERRKDFEREMQQILLLRALRATPDARPSLWRRGLHYVGVWLEALGRWLQTRSEPASLASDPAAGIGCEC